MHLTSAILICFLTMGISGQGRGYSSSSSDPKRILLSDVASLTLRADRMTSHRRVPAIPQLKCVSPSRICRLFKIQVMRCNNAGAGYDDEDIQWTCKADLPVELKLGRTDVICEGYSGPDDVYVLRGSCGVEYTMVLTEEGRERYPGPEDETGWTWGGALFAILFLGIAGWMVHAACSRRRRNGRHGRSRGGDGGNGGWWPGGGPGGWAPDWGPGSGGESGRGDNDPPPPYPGPSSSSDSSKRGNQRWQQERQQQGWRPGFWTGLAGGAAAGYLAGQQRNTQQQQDDSYQSRGPWGGWRWGSDRDRWDYRGVGGRGRHYGYGGRQDYGSTWGGGREPYSRSDGEGSSTGAVHESTGFGSTSRR